MATKCFPFKNTNSPNHMESIEMNSAASISTTQPGAPVHGIAIKSTDYTQLQQCLAIFKPHASNEEWFAGLTILPRLLDPLDETAMDLAYDHLPWKFLRKLLIPSVSDNAKVSESELPTKLLQTIALHIWSGFCAVSRYTSKQSILKCIIPASTILKNAQLCDEVVTLIATSFLHLADSPASVRLWSPEVMSCIIDALCKPSRDSVQPSTASANTLNKSTNDVNTATESGPKTDSKTAVPDHENSHPVQNSTFKYNHKLLAQLLDMLIERNLADLTHNLSNPASTQTITTTLTILDYIVTTGLCAESPVIIFMLVEYLVKIMSVLPIGSIQVETSLNVAMKRLLKTILRGKLSPEYQDLSLSLAALHLRHVREKGLFVDTSSTGAEMHGNARILSDGQYIAILTHMACAEIRVILDQTDSLIQPSPIDINNTTGAFDSKSIEATAKPVTELSSSNTALNLRNLKMLPLCYTIVETIIQYLVLDRGDLSIDILFSLRTALSEAFLAVEQYLLDRQTLYQHSSDILVLDDLYTAYSLKAYSLWIAENGSSSPENLEKIVPLIVHFCDAKLSILDTNPICFMTPILAAITTESPARDTYIRMRGYAAPAHFLMQSIADDDLKIAVLSILLNVVVADHDIISNDSIFIQILDTLMQRTSENQEHSLNNISLLANKYALICMIVRSLKSSQLELVPMASVLGTFSGIFHFVKSNSRPHIADAQHEQISDMWFLTVSALAECMPVIAIPQGNKALWRDELKKILLDGMVLNPIGFALLNYS
ncbi:hypothetical protein RTP6_003429 [Batrachochytrium dendrobatidis]